VKLANEDGELRAFDLECAVPAQRSGRSPDEHGASRGSGQTSISKRLCAKLNGPNAWGEMMQCSSPSRGLIG
jgi:hypothetical protein